MIQQTRTEHPQSRTKSLKFKQMIICEKYNRVKKIKDSQKVERKIFFKWR